MTKLNNLVSKWSSKKSAKMGKKSKESLKLFGSHAAPTGWGYLSGGGSNIQFSLTKCRRHSCVHSSVNGSYVKDRNGNVNQSFTFGLRILILVRLKIN